MVDLNLSRKYHLIQLNFISTYQFWKKLPVNDLEELDIEYNLKNTKRSKTDGDLDYPTKVKKIRITTFNRSKKDIKKLNLPNFFKKITGERCMMMI